MQAEKRCGRCRRVKFAGKFGGMRHPITGKLILQSWCLECFRVYAKARRARLASESREVGQR